MTKIHMRPALGAFFAFLGFVAMLTMLCVDATSSKAQAPETFTINAGASVGLGTHSPVTECLPLVQNGITRTVKSYSVKKIPGGCADGTCNGAVSATQICLTAEVGSRGAMCEIAAVTCVLEGEYGPPAGTSQPANPKQ